MTVFAITHDKLVSDRAVWRGSVMVRTTTKQFVMHSGGWDIYIVGAGDMSRIHAVTKLLVSEITTGYDAEDFVIQHNAPAYLQLFDDDEIQCIVVFVQGDDRYVYELGCTPVPVKCELPFVGGHSDAVKIAIGALDAGATPEDAIRIALRRTGLSADNLELDVSVF